MINKYISKYKEFNWTMADQAMVSGVNFLTGLLLARFLGLEAFGRFTLLWMVIQFLNSLQFSLISAPMMSIGPKQKDADKSAYYNAVLAHQFLFSIATFVIIYIGSYIVDIFKPEWGLYQVALPFALASFFFQNQDFIRRYFFCQNKIKTAFLNDFISYMGQILIIICLFLNFEVLVPHVLWIIAFTSGIAVIWGLKKVDFHIVNFNQIAIVAKRNIILSKWMTASAIMEWTSGNFFILSAGAILGPYSVGVLKAAQNIVGVTHILFQGLENIMPIKASLNLVNSGADGLKKYIKSTLIIGGSAISLICLFVWYFADELMPLVYGDTYSEYGNVLRWYTVIYLLIFICLPVRVGLRALEKTRSIFIAYVLMTIFSFTCSTVMIENWALNGALSGILITQIIMLCTIIITFRKQLSVI
jgi:O-antigen/teichoic acid export membrane protein